MKLHILNGSIKEKVQKGKKNNLKSCTESQKEKKIVRHFHIGIYNTFCVC